MVKWIDRFSLRTQLSVGFAALIGLMLAVAIAALVSQQRALAVAEAYFGHYDRINDLSLQSNAALLKARRYEKEFLLKRGEFGYDEAKSRYATLVRTQLATVRDHMETIRRLADDPEVARQAEAITAVASRYESAFMKVVDLYGHLGRIDSGLEGHLRDAAHAIEVRLERGAPERLLVDLLSLRRVEKDFILRGQGKQVDAFALAHTRFRDHLMASSLPATRRDELLRLANDYRHGFEVYVGVKADIEAGTLAYLGEVHAIEAMLDQLYRNAYATIDTTRATLHRLNVATIATILGACLVAILLGMVVAVSLGRHLARSIRVAVDFAARVAGGDFTGRLPTGGRNEFGLLANGLNQMAASLDEARRLEASRVAELDHLNRTLRVLSQCNNSLVRAGSEPELLDAICRHVVETGGYRLAWVGFAESDAIRSIRPSAMAGGNDGFVEGLGLSWGDDPGRWGLAGRAIHTGQLALSRDLLADPNYAPWQDAAERRGFRSGIALPLISRSAVVGALTLFSDEVGDFESAEIKLLQELADDLAFGLASLRDAAARVQAEQALDYHTNFDAVTGLANRHLLHNRLHQAIAYATRNGGLVAVLLVGLDRFQAINDSLGRRAGDALLNEVGQRLVAGRRDSDTVARLTGDEFAVVIGDAARAEDLAPVARKLLEAIGQPITLDGRELTVSAGLGIGFYPKDGTDIERLLRNAEAAMRSAKSLGGNTFRFYTPEMNERVSARFALEVNLRRAIERGELVVHYQPKVSLETGKVIGAEALVRWCHPEMGLVSPADFIPLAEDTGLILPLGDWVRNEVCAQLRTWLDAALSVPSVAVNLSPRQFRQDQLPQRIRDSLHAHHLPANLLELEITESSLMENLDTAVATLQELKAIGVGLSLDDFGTGYSSLSYLKRFPIDALKIDQTFVRDITTDPDDAAICLAVINLAHNLKLKVIAEGVESEGQLAYLRQHDCDQIQGYYFSRPLPTDEFTQLLANNRMLALPQTVGDERKLLIVDDEPNILSSLKRLLRSEGYEILTTTSTREAFELLALHDVQVVLSDQRMPEMNGTEFLSRVKELHPATTRLVLSGYTDLQSVTEAINRGAIYKFLTKPWEDEYLRDQLREAFRHQKLVRQKG